MPRPKAVARCNGMRVGCHAQRRMSTASADQHLVDDKRADRHLRQHQHQHQRPVGVLRRRRIIVGRQQVRGQRPLRLVDRRRQRVAAAPARPAETDSLRFLRPRLLADDGRCGSPGWDRPARTPAPRRPPGGRCTCRTCGRCPWSGCISARRKGISKCSTGSRCTDRRDAARCRSAGLSRRPCTGQPCRQAGSRQ